MVGVTWSPSAVVLGLSPTGLYVVRELGRAGLPVVGVSRKAQSGGVSNYLSDYRICESQQEMLDFLVCGFAGEQSKPVLIPTTDRESDFVGDNAQLCRLPL